MKNSIICLLFPLYIFSQKDTILYTKKINVLSGIYLSIPQERSKYYYWREPFDVPNGDRQSPYVVNHVTKSIFQSSVLGNGLNLYAHLNFSLLKKLYFETGVDVALNFQKNTAYGDSLYLTRGLWGIKAVSSTTICNFSIPIGLQYRANKKIMVSGGFAFNICTLTIENIIYYQGYNTFSEKKSSCNGQFFPTFFMSSDLRILPRTFLSLKISNTFLLDYNSVTILCFSPVLYYSVGIRFFIY